MKNSAQIAYEGLLTALSVVLLWLAAAVPEDFLDKINNYTKIGVVNPKRGDIKFTADGIGYTEYDEIKPYNHFGERL